MELKPCPFCGGKAGTLQSPDSYWTVECKSCRCCIGWSHNINMAVRFWNTRHLSDQSTRPDDAEAESEESELYDSNAYGADWGDKSGG